MQKVVIADDEEKICQLIEKLVDWKALDMEVAGIAHNGLDAYEKIREYMPDIVITDIRMPGMDGLEMIRLAKTLSPSMEFIIISGYRHFEYARNAIKYGVSDYLLKPVKKEELKATLTQMRATYLERTENLTFEERVLLAMKNDEEKIRTGFFSCIIYPKDRSMSLKSLEEINRDYYFRFRPGMFQMVSIKLDGVGEVLNSNLQFLTDKIVGSMNANLKELCYDLEIYFENSRSYCLLNYDPMHRKRIRKGLKSVLDELALQESILQGLRVTIGCGTLAEGLDQAWSSMQVAIRATEQRLLAGTGRVIDALPQMEAGCGLTNLDLFRQFNRNMNQALERLDPDMTSRELDRLLKVLVETEGITGHEILQMTKDVCNLYLLYMRSHSLQVAGGEYFLDTFNIQANGYYNVGSLFSYLKETILKSFKTAAEEKRQADHKPIRVAKEYIRENYSRPVTLEEVSAIAGFNPSYFSTLFKKETGSTFLEFLSETRMEQAKKLLKETDHSVAVICGQVGYSDVKYFTKSFIKYSGIKPNEYRKLYS